MIRFTCYLFSDNQITETWIWIFTHIIFRNIHFVIFYSQPSNFISIFFMAHCLPWNLLSSCTFPSILRADYVNISPDMYTINQHRFSFKLRKLRVQISDNKWWPADLDCFGKFTNERLYSGPTFEFICTCCRRCACLEKRPYFIQTSYLKSSVQLRAQCWLEPHLKRKSSYCWRLIFRFRRRWSTMIIITSTSALVHSSEALATCMVTTVTTMRRQKSMMIAPSTLVRTSYHQNTHLFRHHIQKFIIKVMKSSSNIINHTITYERNKFNSMLFKNERCLIDVIVHSLLISPIYKVFHPPGRLFKKLVVNLSGLCPILASYWKMNA